MFIYLCPYLSPMLEGILDMPLVIPWVSQGRKWKEELRKLEVDKHDAAASRVFKDGLAEHASTMA